MLSTLCYVALGSNLNNPTQQLNTAISTLKKIPHTQLLKTSSFYQTKPVGFSEQPDFMNAVVSLETTLTPHKLLAELQKIETQQGRVRTIQNGPRTIDVDLLLYGDEVINTPELTVPHPRMHEREFVLTPLREIAPELKF